MVERYILPGPMKFDDPPTGHDFSDGLSHSNLNNLRCVFRPRGIFAGTPSAKYKNDRSKEILNMFQRFEMLRVSESWPQSVQ